MSCTAFEGFGRLVSGRRTDVAQTLRTAFEADETRSFLVFDDRTGEQIDFDLTAPVHEDTDRSEEDGASLVPPEPSSSSARRTPGRPRLGVVAREVTLLPRHWEWLGRQSGGASVALRRLVDQARKQNEAIDRVREGQEAGYRFMSAVAGNLAGFEEASRALFGGDRDRFGREIAAWPPDVQSYLLALSESAFGAKGAEMALDSTAGSA